MRSKKPQSNSLNRRQMLVAGAIAGSASLAGPRSARAAASSLPVRGSGPDIYSLIGVKPFINCTSTYTINGGSAMLPEVIEAMNSAAFYPVNFDELMEGAGKRLAELLHVEAAMVSSGTAGAITCATLACVAGGDPEKMQQLPDTTGLKNEVVVPRWSRSVYDHAVRSTGVKMVEVETVKDLEEAFGPKTAMATGQINLAAEGNPFTLEQFVAVAHKHGVPVVLDVADRLPLVPNPYLSRGADLAAYSGGKIIRGPQTAGILLGRKDLVDAAFMNSAPHHAFARAMKVSKEEIVGMVKAIEMLRSGKRNRDAEDKEWRSWFLHITNTVSKVPGVSGEIIEPKDKQYYPTMKVVWDKNKIGITAGDVGKQLLNGEPRIMTHAGLSEGNQANEMLLRPVAMWADEYKIVADRIHKILSEAPGPRAKPQYAPPAGNVAGLWEAEISFKVGSTRHTFYLDADANQISGQYTGRLVKGSLKGHIDGNTVEFTGGGRYEGTSLRYTYEGTFEGKRMSGTVDLGEYGKASFSATRKT
ncbi:MAG TPA: aminotransferase class V-fold PLP-dependent enzyme [Bryobacteraceae bacterium]|nr:aminotransferase class V-fold PLP-dependent enzyme [Bryobacteraceae bacterium]